MPAWMSFPPARRRIILGSYGKMMRSAKYVASAIIDPPNPRFRTVHCAKSSGSDFHNRIDDAPVNRIAPFDGGFSRSAFSYADISFSHRAGPAGLIVVVAGRVCANVVDANTKKERTLTAQLFR